MSTKEEKHENCLIQMNTGFYRLCSIEIAEKTHHFISTMKYKIYFRFSEQLTKQANTTTTSYKYFS